MKDQEFRSISCEEHIIEYLRKNDSCDIIDLLMWLKEPARIIVNAVKQLARDGKITMKGEIMEMRT